MRSFTFGKDVVGETFVYFFPMDHLVHLVIDLRCTLSMLL
jgi:hypothetical protein